MNKLILMRRNIKDALYKEKIKKSDVIEQLQNLEYIKSLNLFEKKNNKVVYCFWTGENKMSIDRKGALLNMFEKIGLPIVLVNEKNLDYFIKSDKLHPAYKYLSETHRSDYLRIYFMKHFGGGYTDIKAQSGSWIESFEKISKLDEIWMVGYDKNPTGPNVGLGSFICKADTPLINELYDEIVNILDKKLNLLKLYPSKFPQDVTSETSNYPLVWTEILAQPFIKIISKYIIHYDGTLPHPYSHHYR